jgi:hypothetical protein
MQGVCRNPYSVLRSPYSDWLYWVLGTGYWVPNLCPPVHGGTDRSGSEVEGGAARSAARHPPQSSKVGRYRRSCVRMAKRSVIPAT